jgi:hypothetical protein
MAVATAHQRRELQLIESVTSLGAVVGLVLALDSPDPAARCRGQVGECVGQSLLSVLKPYVVHAAVGAAVGLAFATLLVFAWRSRRDSGIAAAPRREAMPERIRHEVWRRDRGTCVECGSRGRLEFDHIIPVSRGGSNTVRNIELRCEPCNRRKGARV